MISFYVLSIAPRLNHNRVENRRNRRINIWMAFQGLILFSYIKMWILPRFTRYLIADLAETAPGLAGSNLFSLEISLNLVQEGR